jgi:hypothetical protein
LSNAEATKVIQDTTALNQPIDPNELTAKQTQAVGPLEENASLTFTSVGQAVRLYADAGDMVLVRGLRDNGTGSATYEFNITGYLIDLP